MFYVQDVVIFPWSYDSKTGSFVYAKSDPFCLNHIAE